MVRRAIFGTMLCALMTVAVEPGLPSKTSILTTALRAIGARNPDPELRNPDDLAIRFLGEKERASLTTFPMDAVDLDFQAAIRRLSAEDRISVTTMFIRTKFIDSTLDEALRNKDSQVVILGAGFDSRGYRFADRRQNVRFLEVDYGPTHGPATEAQPTGGRSGGRRPAAIGTLLNGHHLKSGLRGRLRPR